MSKQGRTAPEVLRESLEDPAFRREWERTFLAETVALELAAYRARHSMSHADLATKFGMKQAAIARLEAATHEPTVPMLARFSRALGIAFTISITPGGAEAKAASA